MKNNISRQRWNYCTPPRILQNRIRLGTELPLNLKILIFLNKLSQKEYFCSKAEKMNIIVEFCLFGFVQVPNFSLN